MERPKVLVIDGEEAHRSLICAELGRQGVQPVAVSSGEAALRQFTELRPRIILSDLELTGMSGLDLLDRVIAADPGADFVLMTVHYSTESAVDAIRRGASDCLQKPVDLEKLRTCLKRLLDGMNTRQRILDLDRQLTEAYQFEGMVGRSPLLLAVFEKIRRVAPHFRSVLITGATGTGKELAANALHRLSPVANKPFAVCNCSALAEGLIEAELFGHVKGSFTGAYQDRRGVFEYANGGVVFLDEIGELPLSAQARLLRVLQNQEIQRVGSPVCNAVDVRVVVATHRNLRKMIAQGRFREDLYYRLSVVEINLPSLAQRKEDIALLLRHFLEKYSAKYGKRIKGVTRRAQARLMAHSWPGNVRELENVISGSCVLAAGSLIDVHDLPPIFHSQAATTEIEPGTLLSLEEVERQHVLRVLQSSGQNKTKAAEILGVGRNTLYQMLNRMRSTAPRAADGLITGHAMHSPYTRPQ